jgi:hypothetical protein
MKFYSKIKFMSKSDIYRNKNGALSKYPFGDNKIAELPISLFIDYTPSNEELKINPYNILMIMEPNEYFGLHNYAIQNSYLFSCILT